MRIVHVALYVYAVRINVKVHYATLAVTMECNYIGFANLRQVIDN